MKLDNVIAVRKDKTVYRDGDKTIKVFNENYSKADILNEALNLARVEETGLNVPKIEEVGVIDGKWCIVTDYIEGKTLAKIAEDNPEMEDEYLKLFVEIQLKIHNQRCALLTKLKDKMRRKISLSGLDATTRYELSERLDGMPKHIKLCHGDYIPTNIILKSDGTPYILDWAHATQGNASADVARTYLQFNLKNKPELADKYLEAFCDMSDTPKQYVQRWMPIVAASQMAKGKPEEKDFLTRWASVCEYE
ncbi:MAG: phosphotransferase [Firmicutes bacterium]|nr:phosphotransferase [[Eubacterium] siraeum]MCM1488057.1 phosphotransferase [Bacillota bacterium]